MGGTFNPIHNAHITLAKTAKEQFGLDLVIFMTGGNPPHKKDRSILDADIRHKMVKMAIDGEESFTASDYEVKKETYSYTVETLMHLNEEYRDSELYFILGADSLHDIPTWYKPEEILRLCTVLVYERVGYDTKSDYDKLIEQYNANIQFINAKTVDISSSQIRKMISEGEDVSEFLDEEVYDFIKRNNLYKSYADYENIIKNELKESRYIHSINVAKVAKELAKHYGCDEEKAYIAGLVHDCAKNMSYEKMMKKCEDYDVLLDEFEMRNPFLIHAKVGEKVAQHEYGIDDEEILGAIKWHTVGNVGMSVLEKIIFIADMIEEERKFSGVEKIRNLAYTNLDLAIKESIESTIRFAKANNREIHPNAYSVLEYISKNRVDN